MLISYSDAPTFSRVMCACMSSFCHVCFLNKMDEIKNRFLADSTPDIIAVTEVLPKNMRLNIIKAELELP